MKYEEAGRLAGKQCAPKNPNAATVTVQERSVNAIPSQFTHDGYAFRLIQRVGDVALFEKAKSHSRATYEVVIVQKRPARTIFGQHCPPHEAMPSAQSWGRQGWTYSMIGHALRKFRARASRQSSPSPRVRTPASASIRYRGVTVAEVQS